MRNASGEWVHNIDNIMIYDIINNNKQQLKNNKKREEFAQF